MNVCKTCGKPVKRPFLLCFRCYENAERLRREREYYEMTPQEHEDEREAYYNRECVMCGKEGADTRKDGKNYCGTCWTVWNS